MKSVAKHMLSRPSAIECLEARQLFAVTLKLDYSLDSTGFFADSTRRSALQQAATTLQQRLGDTLSAIVPSGTNTWSLSVRHPGTGATQSITNPTIVADTVVIYAGGRELGDSTLGVGGNAGWSASGTQSWLDTVRGRGEPGALTSTKTDTATLAGSIAFDVTTSWFFGSTTSGLSSTQSDFLSVALHELGHVIGISSGNAVWAALTSGGTFTGSKSVAAYGAAVPLSPDLSHFAEGTRHNGVETAMDPTVTRGTRKLFTPLDYAALDDIGWDVVSPPTGAAGSIAGTAFNDLDADGIRDTGEAGLASMRVYLDADKDGVFDSTELSTLTDSGGNYKFSNLAAATFRVRQVTPGGYRTTTPSAGYHDVTLTSGQAVTGKLFGDTQKTKITGNLFNDLDGDGIKETGDTALSGWRVYIDADKDNVLDAGELAATTDTGGNYTLVGTAATLRLRTLGPSGYRATLPTSGYYDFTLASGATATRNFGYTQKVLISGNVFRDADGDGVKDVSETGLGAWRVFLDADKDGFFDTGEKSVLTDSAGNWAFKGEAGGTFNVRVVQQSGFTRTTPAGGVYTFTLAGPGTRTNLLFGQKPIA